MNINIGDRVILKDLRTRRELNGKTGEVYSLAVPNSPDRYGILLDLEGEDNPIGIRQRNIFVIPLRKNTEDRRLTVVDGQINVAYGFNRDFGVFLAVTDKRLHYDPTASPGVNAVTEQTGTVKDGGGSYVDLHTGRGGFGLKVDDQTMATYLKRYGASPEEVATLPLYLPRSWTY
jgi:hypothetical protein